MPAWDRKFFHLFAPLALFALCLGSVRVEVDNASHSLSSTLRCTSPGAYGLSHRAGAFPERAGNPGVSPGVEANEEVALRALTSSCPEKSVIRRWSCWLYCRNAPLIREVALWLGREKHRKTPEMS
jgi:hypothetical protein